jgi:signal transduction histidine kinase/CheY-like chemotaxis protein
MDEGHSLLGALVFGSAVPRVFSERSERIVASIASQAAVAIGKARLFDSVKAASEAKDKFLAMISHELRTPLNPVLAIVSSLNQDATLPPAVREDIAVVLRNVQLEARLIDDLLDFHRIIKGNLEFSAEAVDLHAMIRNVLEICDVDLLARGHRLEIHLEAPHFTVIGDPARLQQVLWNVVKNAIKFTPPKGCIAIHTSAENQDTLLVVIADNGRGIEPEFLQGIFDAFEQGSVDGITRFGGLGLGLAITKAFVEKHKGTVSAVSPGRDEGTTISIRLPLPALIPPELLPVTVPYSIPNPEHPARRILLIDDHPDTLWALTRLLTRHGYVVTSAANCADALAEARSGRFDIVISDLGLPDGSGLELIKDIRQHAPVRAIALSGYGMESDLIETAEAGFDLHLTKPVVLQSLLKAIESLT